MAANISEHNNVHQLDAKRGRGRPKGSGVKGAAGKSAAAVAKAEAIMRGDAKKSDAPKPAEAPAKTQQEILDNQASAAVNVTAPSFGANEPDEPEFLKWVQIEIKDLEEIAILSAQLKARRGSRKDHRNDARGAGVILGDMDYAVKRATTEQVDVAAEFRRRALYCQWLGLEVGTQAKLEVNARQTPEQVKKYWFGQGEKSGRLGKPRGTYPDGMPPENTVDHLSGWDHAQTKLLRNSPLTAGAFEKDGSLKEEAAVDGPKVLYLRESDFQAGIEIKDANRSTLFDDEKVKAFDAAENVCAVFGDKKRSIKEPGYVDDGDEKTPLSEVEPASTDEDSVAEFE